MVFKEQVNFVLITTEEGKKNLFFFPPERVETMQELFFNRTAVTVTAIF